MGHNGSESKTKPIVFPFFFWGGVRYVSFFLRSCVCEIHAFEQMLMEGIIERFCQETPLQFSTISVMPSLRNLFLGTSGQRSTLAL